MRRGLPGPVRTGPHALSDYFEVRAKDKGVEAQAGGAMVVLPQVANVV